MSAPRLVLSCEHAGRERPERWTHLLESPEAQAALDGHQGFDLGALEAAEQMAESLGAPLIVHRVTRLLVDANRAETNPRVFSRWTRDLSREEKAELVEALHRPHRGRVLAEIEPALPVLHVAVHSFTPVWEGEERGVDVGLLYDPTRPSERALAERWRSELQARAPELRVRRNAPYRGRDDGLPTALRRRFGDADYQGFELELSAGLTGAAATRRAIVEAVSEALRAALTTSRGAARASPRGR